MALEAADLVTAHGGTGIPVRVDHTAEDQVAALFERVGREQGRLDVPAIVMTGQPASWRNFLDETPAEGKTFVEGWIWPHVMTAWHGAHLMVQQRAGLIVELVEQDNVGYHGAFYFDLMETLLKRLVPGVAHDLGKSGLTAVAVAPGFMRTEAILEGFGVTEANWRDALGWRPSRLRRVRRGHGAGQVGGSTSVPMPPQTNVACLATLTSAKPAAVTSCGIIRAPRRSVTTTRPAAVGWSRAATAGAAIVGMRRVRRSVLSTRRSNA